MPTPLQKKISTGSEANRAAITRSISHIGNSFHFPDYMVRTTRVEVSTMLPVPKLPLTSRLMFQKPLGPGVAHQWRVNVTDWPCESTGLVQTSVNSRIGLLGMIGLGIGV